MLRSSSILGIGLAVAAFAAFQVTGCGDSGGGGNPGTGGSTGTAGSTGAAGTTATGVAGTTGSGGADSTGTAGTSSSGSAGSSNTGSGGTSTSGAAGTSATGTGGATGAGGSAFGQPLCPGTVSKGGTCAATDTQFCYKTCGPQSKGVKTETCMNGAYVEMDGCAFDPSMDYACYKLPTAANTMCPGADMPPQASQDCTVDMCNPCNSTDGLPGGMYRDSSANAKPGYCVCQPPSASGRRTWSCASDTAWPCTASGGAPGCI